MPEKQRLFFALWPDETLRAAIAAAVRAAAGREMLTGARIAPERYHLTLLFLGELDAGDAAAAQQAAQTVRAEPFRFTLDQLGYFRRAKVLWLGPQATPAPLAALGARLREAMRAARVPHDRAELTPHLTCLRKVNRAIRPAAIDPIHWPVKEFVLVHSILSDYPEYRVLARWPLGAHAAASVKTG